MTCWRLCLQPFRWFKWRLTGFYILKRAWCFCTFQPRTLERVVDILFGGRKLILHIVWSNKASAGLGFFFVCVFFHTFSFLQYLMELFLYFCSAGLDKKLAACANINVFSGFSLSFLRHCLPPLGAALMLFSHNRLWHCERTVENKLQSFQLV